MSIHDGHRGRLKNRYREQDIDGFEEVNALELLLFYAIPQKDTNPLAHELLEKFGSFVSVLDAPYEELVKLKGVSEGTATLIKLIPSLCRYYNSRRTSAEMLLNSSQKAGEYLLPKFIGINNEIVYFLGMDLKGKILTEGKIFEGTVNTADIVVRELAKKALVHNVANVIIAHNHPGGLPIPSTDDLAATVELQRSLSALNIRLVDHIIVAGDRFESLRKSGFISEMRARTL